MENFGSKVCSLVGLLVTNVSHRHTAVLNQEDSEQNKVGGMKKGADSTGKVMHI